MKGLASLFLGIFGTFAFSWVGLVLIPNAQIGHLSPQSDEEGTDIYPMPPSGMVERGRHVFAANGCVYCHSQQLRPGYVSSDLDRLRDWGQHPKWGERRSAPRDYIFDRPVLLGKERMGPDLANIGKAAPTDEENAATASAKPSPSPGASPGASPSTVAGSSPAPAPAAAAASPSPTASVPPASGPTESGSRAYSAAWHHLHLYAPRVLSRDSNMPAFRFLYEKRLITGERSADALELTDSDAPPAGWEIVPTYEAKCLVAFLMSLDQSHPLAEVKSGVAASPPAPASSPAAAASPAPAGSPAK
jgi:cbb3-type cytochrome oxidase cytochrome c subunit